MKIDVHGGKVLLIVGDGALARVKNDDNEALAPKATLVASQESALYVGDKSIRREPIGACFTNGAAADPDDKWLTSALKFLGYVVYKLPRLKKLDKLLGFAVYKKPKRKGKHRG